MNLDACTCTELNLLKECLTWLHHYGVRQPQGSTADIPDPRTETVGPGYLGLVSPLPHREP